MHTCDRVGRASNEKFVSRVISVELDAIFYREFNQSIKAIHNTSGTSDGTRQKWECSNKSKNPTRANMTEKQIAELNTKIKLLYFKLNQTDEIVEKRERQYLERHQSSITNIANALDTLKSAVE